MNETDNVATLRRSGETGPVAITGGAGFLGCNIADALASRGEQVLLLDNCARARVRENLQWLAARHPRRVEFRLLDVRDGEVLRDAVAGARAVIHLAAQVAVTTSIEDPLDDFETNARGTLNVLESVRAVAPHAPVLFASTNKVYGACTPEGGLARNTDRYVPNTAGHPGFGEATPLDFHSPYGCSKGVADQYVIDYGRIYGLDTAVFRMSCLYGPHQFGIEDQGWIAHFAISVLTGRPITIYGDGCQVRDALYVEDAVAAYLLALDNMEAVKGCAYNLGGGPGLTLSPRECLDRLARLTGIAPQIGYADWRPGDQLWYVSDTRRLRETIGWAPRVDLEDGLARLVEWLRPNYAQRAQERASP